MYYFRRLSDSDVPLSQPIPSHLSCVPKYQELPQKKKKSASAGEWAVATPAGTFPSFAL